MLAVLKIKNLALVEDQTWELGRGLICVTGQTGAGKSMIVGALKLILGDRASRDLIRNGETICTVEAIFRLSTNLEKVNDLLSDCGLEACDGENLIIKRSFGSGNSQFVNCSACTLSVLKRLGQFLIDLHGPNEHQSLLSQDRQLAMLDAYAKCSEEHKNYLKIYHEWMKVSRALEEFRCLGNASDQEIALLRYQFEEISNASLIEAQIIELDHRYNIAKNAAKLIDSANRTKNCLEVALTSLGEARKHLNDLEKLDSEALTFTGGFDSAALEIEALESNLGEYLGGLEIDPAEMQELENRIDQVESLKRKYGQTISEVLAFANKVRSRLEIVDHREEEESRLTNLLTATRAKLEAAGAQLTTKRKGARENLESDIISHLVSLGFKQAVFKIRFEEHLEPGISGMEGIDFLFCPNPGEEVKPLRIIASSGEISRVMLAVKSALADQDETPLMVFDEIDANVGGEIAGAVGAKMAALGDRHQVISITHMPQVAARAAFHYRVTKEVENGMTISKIEKVAGSDRVEELARMLGGVGDESLALARKMLNVPHMA